MWKRELFNADETILQGHLWTKIYNGTGISANKNVVATGHKKLTLYSSQEQYMY